MKKERVKLTGAEKSELFAEGVVTVVLLFLLNLSIIILIHLAILQDESLVNGIYFLKRRSLLQVAIISGPGKTYSSS